MIEDYKRIKNKGITSKRGFCCGDVVLNFLLIYFLHTSEKIPAF